MVVGTVAGFGGGMEGGGRVRGWMLPLCAILPPRARTLSLTLLSYKLR